MAKSKSNNLMIVIFCIGCKQQLMVFKDDILELKYCTFCDKELYFEDRGGSIDG